MRQVKDNDMALAADTMEWVPAAWIFSLSIQLYVGVRLSPAGLMVTVPAPLTVTDCANADQVRGLPPVAASNMPA